MRSRPRRSGCSAALASCLALAVGCGTAEAPAPPPTSAPAPRDPDTLVLAVRADVTGIFPNAPIQAEGYTIDVNRNVFGTLVAPDAELNPRPGLALRWENPDDRTYVFELRPDLRFADGRPLTSADVAASLEAVRSRRWTTRDMLQAIESVEADGPRRLVIRTRGPYPALLPRLSWGFVLPAEDVAQARVPPTASGPYELVEWHPGRELTLRRNPHYWGEAPDFEHVRYVVVPDAEERIAMVRDGRADVADHMPLDDLERLASLDEATLKAAPGLRVLFLALAVDRRPFADPMLREALDKSIDRSELIERALGGQGLVATQPAAPGVFGVDPALPEPRPDRKRTRALLAAAAPEGLAVRLDAPLDRYAGGRAVADEIARQAAEVGIRIEVNALPKAAFFRLVDAGESPLHLLSWSCNSGDVSAMLESLFHSPTGEALGAFNSFGLADAELDAAIRASQSSDRRQRQRALQACMARVVEVRAALPLVVQTEALLVANRIAWEPPVDFALRPAEMRRVAP